MIIKEAPNVMTTTPNVIGLVDYNADQHETCQEEEEEEEEETDVERRARLEMIKKSPQKMTVKNALSKAWKYRKEAMFVVQTTLFVSKFVSPMCNIWYSLR